MGNRPLAQEKLWWRVLSVVVGADRSVPRIPVALIRERYPLSRRVAAIVFNIPLAAPCLAAVELPVEHAEVRAPVVRGPRTAFAFAAGVFVLALLAVSFTITRHPPAVTSVPPASTEVTTTTTTSTSSPITAASALTQLNQRVTDDHTAVEALVGRWVPVLSSKRPGLVAGGITYDYPAIWADHNTLASVYPGALLLKSEDYANFSERDFWVTVAGQGFATAAAANAWCDSKSIGPGDCFATRLMHTGGPAGNTVSR